MWWNAFKADSFFRKLFVLAFYTAMLLFRTLLNRDIWANPLSDVIGGAICWIGYKVKSKKNRCNLKKPTAVPGSGALVR